MSNIEIFTANHKNVYRVYVTEQFTMCTQQLFGLMRRVWWNDIKPHFHLIALDSGIYIYIETS